MTAEPRGKTAKPGTEFSPQDRLRYARQLMLPEFGPEGQRRLRDARILIIGLGGLGSPAAIYLAAAGVGTLGLVDPDTVGLSNLHRQVVHPTSNLGRSKVESAAGTLRGINPSVRTVLHRERFTPANALELVRGYDIVLDASDNFPTRYLANDACVLLGKPLVYGAILRFDGQASVFDARRGPCYRCLYPEPPPAELAHDCSQAGVIGVLPGVIGLVQATEAVKLAAGIGDPLIGRLLLFDALGMKFSEMRFERDPACKACGPDRVLRGPSDLKAVEAETCAAPGGPPAPEIAPRELKAMMDRKESFQLLDVREPVEHEICALPGSKLIPLGQLAARLGELDPERPVVVYCRSGGRSAVAARRLMDAGYKRVLNLRGGTLAWSDDVDPSTPRY